MNKWIYVWSGCILLSCCGQKQASGNSEPIAVAATKTFSSPEFNRDSAYAYVARQVAFGPRVPNTPAHKACALWLAGELERFGAKIYVQEATLTAYNGDRLEAKNIIGSFHPDKAKRVLLCAHWDTRPYSDRDEESNHHKPIDGADDGASGVGVLLEIARQMSLNDTGIGVDILFFDAEDYGTPKFANESGEDTWWCLGSQFWAKNPHTPNYRADYGILLDMVGARNATFYKESVSVYRAAPVVEKVWTTARNLGYGRYFINANGGAITDDHQFVMAGRGFPCIDIIHLNPDSPHGFGNHWHTQRDAMDNIDRETLNAVGQTVLEVIYSEQ
ncbi:MAG: M28 family peptidase [Tannerella sp.]|jgi:Zn-dependent M28 family amino/carboxypeptidase|nr:M28 family peptidase [Tannerella sp.]